MYQLNKYPYPYFFSSVSLRRFLRILLNIPRNLSQHYPESLAAFPDIFWNITLNLFEHFPESSRTFKMVSVPGILVNIEPNQLKVNISKCHLLVNKNNGLAIKTGDTKNKNSQYENLLGIIQVDIKLDFNEHLNDIISKFRGKVNDLSRVCLV